MRGPAGWCHSVEPPGIDEVGRRIHQHSGYAFAIWFTPGPGSATYGSGWYCGAQAGSQLGSGDDDCIGERVCHCACGYDDGNISHFTAGRLRYRWDRRSGGAWIVYMIPCLTGGQCRVLKVVENWSRHSPVLEAGFRMSGERVGQILIEL